MRNYPSRELAYERRDKLVQDVIDHPGTTAGMLAKRLGLTKHQAYCIMRLMRRDEVLRSVPDPPNGDKWYYL